MVACAYARKVYVKARADVFNYVATHYLSFNMCGVLSKFDPFFGASNGVW